MTPFVERLARKWCPKHREGVILPNYELCECPAIAAAIREALEEAEKIALSFQPSGPSPIGPLHGAGMAFAAKHIATRIAALRALEEPR